MVILFHFCHLPIICTIQQNICHNLRFCNVFAILCNIWHILIFNYNVLQLFGRGASGASFAICRNLCKSCATCCNLWQRFALFCYSLQLVCNNLPFVCDMLQINCIVSNNLQCFATVCHIHILQNIAAIGRLWPNIAE